VRQKKVWLVNDCLTCIPGTETLWHFLLESIDGIEDKTNGHTPYGMLPEKIENDLLHSAPHPDLIIRNATFFRPLRTDIPTISLLQDPYDPGSIVFNSQIEVCNKSSYVVYNSHYTKKMYTDFITTPGSVIEVGTNPELFKPSKNPKNNNTIIYVGSTNEEYKGFSMLLRLIENTSYNFILVMKDDFNIVHPRVKVYNKINQNELSELLSFSDLLVCTSKSETLHLAGIEAAFCDIPVVANNVGIYNKIKNDRRWGAVVAEYSIESYIDSIEDVLGAKNLSPRMVMFENRLSMDDCKSRWRWVVDNILRGENKNG